MKYIEPEMEIRIFSSVQTIIEASQFGNGGAGTTDPDPNNPDVDLGF